MNATELIYNILVITFGQTAANSLFTLTVLVVLIIGLVAATLGCIVIFKELKHFK